MEECSYSYMVSCFLLGLQAIYNKRDTERGLNANPKKMLLVVKFVEFFNLISRRTQPGLDQHQHQSEPGIKRSEIKTLNDCNQIHSRNKIFSTETR